MPKEPTKKPIRKKATDTVARKPAIRRSRKATPAIPTSDEIAFRAYMLSLEGHGDDLANWLRAEQELATA